MHPSPTFREGGTARSLALVRDRSFGALAVNGPQGPLLSHVPFLLDEAGTEADLHLVRSNPILAALARPCAAVIAVQGADAYVSPDWYGIEDQVPTWNYVAVHLRGRLERRPDEEIRDLLDRQSLAAERRLAPKPVWMPDKMTPQVLARLLRAIVPVRLHVESVDATWKLGQNKPGAARLAAAAGIGAQGIGQETSALAALMREQP